MDTQQLNAQQRRYWIALNLICPVIGARRANQLIRHFSSPQQAFAAGTLAWQSLGLSERACQSLAKPDWAAVDQVEAWLSEAGHSLVCSADAAFPEPLRAISDPPILLYCIGDTDLLQRQSLAVVGSRNPSRAGYEFAQELAFAAAKLGFVITSGLALGIDTAGHRGALAVSGATIAVAGTGLDIVYPRKNKELASDISRQGLLVSEFPLGSQPLGRNFPLRNRIISGLSRGVIVVEAALKSGSLITARQALEQGREVFAVPGSIHNPTSRGCHWLLREGAKLVENIEDILEEFDLNVAQPPRVPHTTEPQQLGLDLDQQCQNILAAVDYAPTSVDQVIDRCGLTADVVCSMLLVLELQNFVHITSSGHYCKTGTGSERIEDSVCGIVYR